MLRSFQASTISSGAPQAMVIKRLPLPQDLIKFYFTIDLVILAFPICNACFPCCFDMVMFFLVKFVNLSNISVFLFLLNHVACQNLLHLYIVMALVHSDLCGPYRGTTLSNKKWFLSFIDDHSRV